MNSHTSCDSCDCSSKKCSNRSSFLLLAGSIIIGSVLITGAIVGVGMKTITPTPITLPSVNTNTAVDQETNPTTVKTATQAPTSSNDLSSIGTELSVDGSYEKTGTMPPIDGLPFLGNKDAKVTIVEFSDYECPFCQGFYENIFHNLKKDYIDTGKVKFVFKDFPLFSIHPRAAAVANAAHCAEQNVPGSYYTFHDVVFTNFDKWRAASNLKESLLNMASGLNLNRDSFETCISSFAHKATIEKNLTHGYAWGVRGTPTTFINSKEIKGLADYASMKAAIEAELAK